MNWVNADGMTALSAQVKFGRIERARILLDHEDKGCQGYASFTPRSPSLQVFLDMGDLLPCRGLWPVFCDQSFKVLAQLRRAI